MEDEEIRRTYIDDLMEKLRKSATKNECGSCGCYKAFLAKAASKKSGAMGQEESPAEDGETCQDCNPCPPADVFTQYFDKETGNS